MDNGPVLAPTPIVRITAEQLEYLVARLRDKGGLSTEAKRRWQPAPPSNKGVSNVNFTQFLPYNERRRALWFSAQSQNIQVSVGAGAGLGIGVNVLVTQQMMIFTYDMIGAAIWQPWNANSGNVGAQINFQEFLAADLDI